MKISMSHNCCGAEEIQGLDQLNPDGGEVTLLVRNRYRGLPFLEFVAGYTTTDHGRSKSEVVESVRDTAIYHWITGNVGSQDEQGVYMAKAFRKIGYKVTKINAGDNGGDPDYPLYFYVAVRNDPPDLRRGYLP